MNAGTGGVGAPVLSTVEDTGSVGLSFLAIFVPILVIVALILLGFVIWKVWRRVHAGRQAAARKLAPREPPDRTPDAAPPPG